MATTTNYGGTLPTVGGSSGTWGDENNTLHQLWDTELFKTIYKDGSRAFSGAQAFAVGSASAPGLYFSGDSNSGLYWIGADSIGVTLGGTLRATFSTSGLTLTGAISSTTVTATGLVLTPASATGGAGFRLPHGTAPSSPTNGDVWTTTSGLYARINGSTVGPFSTGGGTWTTPRNLSLTGDVTATLSGVDGSANVSAPATIANSAVTTAKINDAAVTLAKMANLAQATIIGRASGAGTGAPTALSASQAAAIVQGSIDLSSATIGTGSGLSGYAKIGFLYVQFGSVSVDAAQSGTTGEGSVTFPVTFPNAVVSVQATPSLSGGVGGGNNLAAYVRGASTTGCNIGLDQDGTGSNTGITVYWLAIGY